MQGCFFLCQISCRQKKKKVNSDFHHCLNCNSAFSQHVLAEIFFPFAHKNPCKMGKEGGGNFRTSKKVSTLVSWPCTLRKKKGGRENKIPKKGLLHSFILERANFRPNFRLLPTFSAGRKTVIPTLTFFSAITARKGEEIPRDCSCEEDVSEEKGGKRSQISLFFRENRGCGKSRKYYQTDLSSLQRPLLFLQGGRRERYLELFQDVPDFPPPPKGR